MFDARRKYKVALVAGLFAFLLLCSGGWDAQVFYSTDKNYLLGKREGNNLLGSYEPCYPDTAITFIHDYFPRNFAGNTGLPSPSYHLAYGTDDLGFRFYEQPYNNDRFRASQTSYYRSKGPYANLTGIAGSKNLQILKLMFTQTYRERFSIAIRFNRYTSKGFYRQQQTYTNNFALNGSHVSRKSRAGLFFSVLNNSNKNAENGGIRDTFLSDSTSLLNKELMITRITRASRDNRELQLMLNPWLRLNTGKDSARPADHFLQFKSRFINSRYRYKDDNMRADNFYRKVYLDTTATLDSAHVKKLVSEASYVLKSRSGASAFAAGYSNELVQIWQRADSVINNNALFAELTTSLGLQKDSSGRAQVRLNNYLGARYIFKGSNSDDHKVENNMRLRFGRALAHVFYLNLMAERRRPDYIHNTWISNHFLWYGNGFRPIRQVQAEAALVMGSVFRTSVFYQDVMNYLYFNEEALPAQHAPSIRNTGLTLSFSRVFFRHLGLFLEHTIQQSTAPEYVRIPGTISKAGVYYYASLFRDVLQLQVGVQGERYASFLTYAYMPATQVFYQQSYFRSGDYPFVDLYLNARIRPVNIFLKVENVLQGFAGSNYGFMPGYYQPDRAFRFGLSWMFFD